MIGAAFIGSHVTDTIPKGIVSSEVLNDPAHGPNPKLPYKFC